MNFHVQLYVYMTLIYENMTKNSKIDHPKISQEYAFLGEKFSCFVCHMCAHNPNVPECVKNENFRSFPFF